MPEIKFKHFDKYREQGILKGVFLAGCVDRGDGSSFRRKAHAHTGGENKGWICVRSRHRLMSKTGKPSMLMLHEIAHLISGQGHTDKWRSTLRAIGGRVEAHEEKRKRSVHPIYCGQCRKPFVGLRNFSVHLDTHDYALS